jgi:hypothetical protein
MDGHHTTVGGTAIGFLPEATDLARPILPLGAILGRDAERVEAFSVAAVGAEEVHAAGLRLPVTMPVLLRVPRDSAEIHRESVVEPGTSGTPEPG